MGFLILPLVIGVMALPSPTPTGLADFTRLRDAVHDEVYVTDQTGQERRLTIIEAGETAVTAQIGFQSMQMSRDAIVSVDRAGDGNVDGFVKGALIGLLIGSVAESSVSGADGRFLLQGALVYGGIGFLFDRGHVARQPLYRAAARQQP